MRSGLPRRFLLALLALSCCSWRVQAEQIEIADLEYGTFGAASLTEPRPDSFEEELEVQIESFKLALTLPMVLSGGRRVLLHQVRYQLLDLDYRDVELQGVDPVEKLHSLGYRLNLLWELSKRWDLLTTGGVTLASNLEGVSGDHLRGQGAVLLNRRFGDGLDLGLGVSVLNDFGELLVLPALRLDGRGERWRAEALLPRRVELYALLGRSLELGLAARVEGNHYRLGGEARVADRVRYSVVTAGPAAQIRLAGSVFLALEAGAAVARRFEGFTEDDASLREAELESGFFFRGGLRFRIAGGRVGR